MTISFVVIHHEDLSVKFVSTPAGLDGYVCESAEDLNQLSGPQAVALYNATAEELDTGLAPVKRFADKQAAAKRLWANLVDLEAARAEKKAEAERVARVEASAKNKPLKIKTGPAKATDYPAPAPKARRTAGINLKPQKKVYPCREGSKQAILVDMLSRPEGASMQELIRALADGKPWKEVTVKSGLNWDMNKVKGYGIRTTFENEYERWLACDFESSLSITFPRGFEGHPDDNTPEQKAALLKFNIEKGFNPEVRDVAVYHLVLPEGMKAPLPHTPRKKG
ncbi:hypothetical protein EVC26_073 [Rhizobium phage RHph_I72]|nr:hypothetical protein EVC13_071 [Rhizobium phage RHph_I65]QIG76519.1 hypothetical protein EVC26_073 [Rhizobium phage RHph_I72]